MKEQACCPICKNEQCERVSKTKIGYPVGELHSHLLDIDFVRNRILFDEILHSKEPMEFHFEVCKNCGLLFFSPRPEEKDMVLKYRITNELGDSEKRDEIRYKYSYDDKRASKIYKAISNIKHIENVNVVDIGGSAGLNLGNFVSSNACYVVDYEKRSLIDHVEYLCETVQDIPDSIYFDAALYCHTLEHVVDPVRDVLQIKNILKPNGILYIEVPFECSRKYQYMRNFLTHINFFSEGSLWHLLDMCGLNIKYLRTRPALSRGGYLRAIVAIAENSPPQNSEINGYEITRKQMGHQYGLWLYTAFLQVCLKKFRIFPAIFERIAQRGSR